MQTSDCLYGSNLSLILSKLVAWTTSDFLTDDLIIALRTTFFPTNLFVLLGKYIKLWNLAACCKKTGHASSRIYPAFQLQIFRHMLQDSLWLKIIFILYRPVTQVPMNWYRRYMHCRNGLSARQKKWLKKSYFSRYSSPLCFIYVSSSHLYVLLLGPFQITGVFEY